MFNGLKYLSGPSISLKINLGPRVFAMNQFYLTGSVSKQLENTTSDIE